MADLGIEGIIFLIDGLLQYNLTDTRRASLQEFRQFVASMPLEELAKNEGYIQEYLDELSDEIDAALALVSLSEYTVKFQQDNDPETDYDDDEEMAAAILANMS